MAKTTLALCEQDSRLPGMFAVRALIKRVVGEWQRGMWDQWKWPEASMLPALMQHTFRADLEVERERVQWRRAAALPETKGRFVRGEWRDRVAKLTSLDEEQKQRLAAQLRGGAILEAAEETTHSLSVLIKAIEMPEGLNGTFREGFRDAFLDGMKNGSRKAAQQLGFGQDWLLKDPKALAALEDYAGYYGDHLTKLVGMEWQVSVKKAVIRGIDQGLSAAEMSREIQSVAADLTGYEAERIARTEAARARVNGQLGTYLGAGVQMLEYIVGPNPCPEICAPRAGNLYTVSTIRAILPAHPQCECTCGASDDDLDRMRAQALAGTGDIEPLPPAPEPRYQQGA